MQPDRNKIYAVVQKLRLIDDFFMTHFFDGFNEGIQEMLRIILNKNDLKVISSATQKEIRNIAGRSLKLDILAADSSGKYYNIEVQRADSGASFKRARYHSSIIDTNILEKNKNFSEIPDTYVIFITENDVIGGGLPVYNIKRIILQTDKEFDDGSEIVYVNGAYKGTDSEIGKLIHDFFCIRAEDMYNPVLADRCGYVKKLKGDDENMTKLIEDLINEYAELARQEAIVEGKAQGIAEGRAEGRAEGMAEGKAEAMEQARKNQIIAIRSLLKTTNSTPENLALAFNMPVEEIERIAHESSEA